jgi:hypothetical protein
MFIQKCPYCKELIKNKAVLCKHCHSNLIGNGNNVFYEKDEGFKYLQNGFAKIHCECDAIEEKIKLLTGFVFIKHQYSSDELCYAIGRIESFVDKMKDDLDDLESEKNSNRQVRFLFNNRAEEVCNRLESLHILIQQREPTWWEKVKSIIKLIIDKLLSLFPLEMMAGKAMGNLFAEA